MQPETLAALIGDGDQIILGHFFRNDPPKSGYPRVELENIFFSSDRRDCLCLAEKWMSSVIFLVVSDVCYDQGYGSNLDFLTEPSYGIGTEPSYETKNEDSPISYGNGNNFLSYGQPQEG